MKKRIIMGVRYVEQGLLWLAGKGFQQKWAGKLFLEAKRIFGKNSNNIHKKKTDFIQQYHLYQQSHNLYIDLTKSVHVSLERWPEIS
jgi:hypothetical protein